MHVIGEKKKLLNRVRRIKGQIASIEAAIEADGPCEQILQTVAASRGALLGLMTELMEEHILNHVLTDKEQPTGAQLKAAQELVGVIKAYLK